MAQEKSVTSEGIPSSIDIGNVEAPTQESLNSLDQALDAAGVFDQAFPPAGSDSSVSNDQPIGEEKPPTEPDSSQEGNDQLPPDGSKEQEQPKVDQELQPEVQSIDLDNIKAPDDVSPKNLVNFNKLREVAKHFKTEASRIPELEAQIMELHQKVQTTVVPDEIIKELEDHRQFRKIFDTENDPEFKKQYDEKLKSLDDDVLSILTKNGLPQETADKLRSSGLENIPADWWEKTVLPKLSFLDRERVQKRLGERADISDQKIKEIENFRSKRDEFYQQEQQKLVQAYEQEQTQINQHVDILTKDVPWARYMDIPPNAKPEEIKQIEAHNAEVADLEARFTEALYPKTPSSRAEVAAAAVASIKLSSAVNDLASRLRDSNSKAEKLQKELEAIRSAGRSPSARPSGKKSATEAGDNYKLSDEDAIEQGLMAAESSL
jgi:hypothetical protein